jgi:hypothetical protein
MRLIEFRFDAIERSMEAAREAAKIRANSPEDSWAYRLIDNTEQYAEVLVCIQAYPVLKHCLSSFVYLDIYPTTWNRDPSNYGKYVKRRQLDNSGRPRVFFERKALIKDYIRRKTAQHEIHKHKADKAMARLEYAQLMGDIPKPKYSLSDWS